MDEISGHSARNFPVIFQQNSKNKVSLKHNKGLESTMATTGFSNMNQTLQVSSGLTSADGHQGQGKSIVNMSDALDAGSILETEKNMRKI